MKRLKKIGTVLATAVLLVVAAMVLAVTVIPQARGGASLIIETGSMRPTINPGDVVAVRPIDAEDLNIGDIITYATSDALITHRIIAFEGQGSNLRIITQGDANNSEDAPVQPGQVRGIVEYTLPRVGLVLPWITSHVWWIIGAAGIFWLISWFTETFRKMQAEKREAALAKAADSEVSISDVAEPMKAVVATQSTATQSSSCASALGAQTQDLPASLSAALKANLVDVPNATLVASSTSVTAFSEPIEVSAVPGPAASDPPLTVVRTSTMTAAYNEPVTVTSGGGGVNLAGIPSLTGQFRVRDDRRDDKEIWAEIGRWLADNATPGFASSDEEPQPITAELEKVDGALVR